MLTIIVIGLVFVVLFISFLLTVIFIDSGIIKSGLRQYEFEDIYKRTKREFNLKPPKNMLENKIIEKCGNVNNIWNELPGTTKIDISDWVLVCALKYISDNKNRFSYNSNELMALKWKYKTKYLLIKFILQ